MSVTNKSVSDSETKDLIVGLQVPDISVESYYFIGVFINCFLVPILSVLGILGNSVTIIIMTKTGLHNPTDVILTGLAASDLLFSVTQSLFQVASFIYIFDIYATITYFTYFYLYIYFWNQVSMFVSIELVTIIAVERMLAVWFPFHVSRILSPFRMSCLVVFVFLAIPVLVVPFTAAMRYGETTIDGTNRTVAIFVYTKYYLNNIDSFNIYRNYVLLFVTAVFPFLAITCCSLLIILKLIISSRKFTRKFSSSSKRVKDLKSVKVTLLICCSLMLLVIVPINTVDIYYMMVGYFPFGERTHSLFISFLKTILQFNASSNFIIYVTSNSKFMKTYRKIFGNC